MESVQGRHSAPTQGKLELGREFRADVELARDRYEGSGLARMVTTFYESLNLGMRGELLEWHHDLPVIAFGTGLTALRYMSLRRGVRLYFEPRFVEILATVAQDVNIEGTQQRMKSYIIGQPSLPVIEEELPAIAGMLDVAWRTSGTISEEDLLSEASWIDEMEDLESSWKFIREENHS